MEDEISATKAEFSATDGRRVFLDQDKQTVYKLYDKKFSEDPSASNQALKQHGGDYLHTYG